MKKIIYLDVFAGIGGFAKAILEVFPKAKCAGFSEIAPAPIQVYLNHFPTHKNIGDIALIVWKHDKDGNMLADRYDRPILNKKALDKLPYFNFLVGASPCQGLSRANITRRDLADPRSRLFYAFLAILRYKKPKYFLLENVASMKTEIKERISELLGVEPYNFDSGSVSAAHRDRLYWCNWKVKKPKEKNIEWKDIKEKRMIRRKAKLYLVNEKEQTFLNELAIGGATMNCVHGYENSSLYAYSRSIRDVFKKDKKGKLIRDENDKKIKIGTIDERRFRKDGKLNTLVTSKGCGGSHAKNYILTRWGWRLLTLNECARAQNFPDNYCDGISDAQAYKAYGNAVTKDMIVHIFKNHPWKKRNCQ